MLSTISAAPFHRYHPAPILSGGHAQKVSNTQEESYLIKSDCNIPPRLDMSTSTRISTSSLAVPAFSRTMFWMVINVHRWGQTAYPEWCLAERAIPKTQQAAHIHRHERQRRIGIMRELLGNSGISAKAPLLIYQCCSLIFLLLVLISVFFLLELQFSKFSS